MKPEMGLAVEGLRPELDPLPRYMTSLPVHRGFPVPWFVDKDPETGEPEFRAMDPRKWKRAIEERLCWVCGGRLGVYLTFVIGPMCGLNRTTSEPPCHRDCARWSARNCPFLSRPQMERREMEGAVHQAGCPITRNPGVSLLWTTRTFSLFKAFAGNKGLLIRIGDPTEVEWWTEKRRANRRECEESVRTGLPALLAQNKEEDPLAVAALYEALEKLARLFPPDEETTA